MSQKPLYECIRCGYKTAHKSSMRNHLYKNKKPCPAVKNKLDLTDEIKEEIMNNRIYEIKVEPKHSPVFNQNLVIDMENIEKIRTILEHNGKNLLG